MASLALSSYYLGMTFLLLGVSACMEVKCNCLFIFISSKPLTQIGLEVWEVMYCACLDLLKHALPMVLERKEKDMIN